MFPLRLLVITALLAVVVVPATALADCSGTTTTTTVATLEANRSQGTCEYHSGGYDQNSQYSSVSVMDTVTGRSLVSYNDSTISNSWNYGWYYYGYYWYSWWYYGYAAESQCSSHAQVANVTPTGTAAETRRDSCSGNTTYSGYNDRFASSSGSTGLSDGLTGLSAGEREGAYSYRWGNNTSGSTYESRWHGAMITDGRGNLVPSTGAFVGQDEATSSWSGCSDSTWITFQSGQYDQAVGTPRDACGTFLP